MVKMPNVNASYCKKQKADILHYPLFVNRDS